MSSGAITAGWFANLNNSGADFIITVAEPIIITGYQLSVSMAFAVSPTPTGFCELLTYAAFLASPTTPNGTQNYLNGAPFANSDWGVITTIGNPSGGLYTNDGALFSVIMKTNAPDPVNKCVVMSGLSIAPPVGCTLNIHADSDGVGPVNFEMQLILFYNRIAPAPPVVVTPPPPRVPGPPIYAG